jgi:hypothetical protein
MRARIPLGCSAATCAAARRPGTLLQSAAARTTAHAAALSVARMRSAAIDRARYPPALKTETRRTMRRLPSALRTGGGSALWTSCQRAVMAAAATTTAWSGPPRRARRRLRRHSLHHRRRPVHHLRRHPRRRLHRGRRTRRSTRLQSPSMRALTRLGCSAATCAAQMRPCTRPRYAAVKMTARVVAPSAGSGGAPVACDPKRCLPR